MASQAAWAPVVLMRPIVDGLGVMAMKMTSLLRANSWMPAATRDVFEEIAHADLAVARRTEFHSSMAMGITLPDDGRDGVRAMLLGLGADGLHDLVHVGETPGFSPQ